MHKDDIRIDTPCDADWSSMTKEGRRRFCDSCRKHVHDLSSMRRDEVSALFSSSKTQELCVRFIHDEAGNILFSDDERRAWTRELNAEFLVPASHLVRARRAMLVAAASTSLSSGGCLIQQRVGGMTGGPCPEVGSIEAIERIDLQARLDMDAPTSQQVNKGLQAALHIRQLAEKLDGELRDGCGRIASELGEPGPYSSGQAACEKALARLQMAREKLGKGAVIRVNSKAPICVSSIDAIAQCKDRCERRTTSSRASYVCQGKSYCSGTCQGVCDRTGEIPPSIAGECTGGCTGACLGETTCDDVIQGPSDTRECELSCAASVFENTKCIAPRVEVDISGASDEKLAAVLSGTLNKNLGPLLVVSTTLMERWTTISRLVVPSLGASLRSGSHLADKRNWVRFGACFASDLQTGVAANLNIKSNLTLAHAVAETASGRATNGLEKDSEKGVGR